LATSFSLRSKLFAAILLPAVSAVIVMLILWQSGLERAFNNFLLDLEEKPLTRELNRYRDHYLKYGNWQGAPLPKLRRAKPKKQKNKQDHSGNYKRSGPARLGNRLSLYDQDQKVVFGRPDINSNYFVRAIEADGVALGYLGWIPQQEFEDGPDQQLLRQQFIEGSLTGLVIIIICLLVGWGLATHLSRPIRKLGKATEQLRHGKLDLQLDINTGDELAELGQDFNQLAQGLRQAQQHRQEWTTNIAHELRTPVTSLKVQCEAMLDKVVPMDAQRVDRLLSDINRLDRLINDLYQLSLLDHQDLQINAHSLALDLLLQQRVQQFQLRFEQQQIQLQLDIKPGQYLTTGDPDRLGQVFDNILQNSLAYTNTQGQLLIVMQKRLGNIEIRFEDSKPGMDDEQRAKLFERLYRADLSRSRNSGGAGLGMALVKALLEAQAASISSYPSPLGGLGLIIKLREAQDADNASYTTS